MMHTPTLTPGEGISLPHRVTVKTVRSAAQNLASYQCPGCGKQWPTNRTLVNHLAHWHATTCTDLRAINRRALACWNCNGAGRHSRTPSTFPAGTSEVCLVCLGRGWTTEPDPTTSKERTR